MPILSLMTWNHFPFSEEDIMLLLDCDSLYLHFPLLSARNDLKRENNTMMPFSLNILSRTFLSYGFCYYLYLRQYSFIFIMYLFLSVHLESGDIIFLLYREEMWSYGKKSLELSLTTSKDRSRTHAWNLQGIIGSL